MHLFLKAALASAGALVVGLGAGFFVGRATLESSWSEPFVAASAPPADGDPAPAAGTKVVKTMPIGRARVALAERTKDDALVATVASVGAGDEGTELHVTVENRAKCKVTAASGVAYGFTARGRPAPTNKGGAMYVAFALATPIEPGAKGLVAQKLRFADDATLAIAHVDQWTCADGTAWKR